MVWLDCKLLICEILCELKSAKVSFLEEQLMWRGVEKDDINDSIRTLQERGVIYRNKNGVLELAEPVNS